MMWRALLKMVGLRSAFHSIDPSPLPFICTYVQLFAGRAGAHHVLRASSRVGSTLYAHLATGSKHLERTNATRFLGAGASAPIRKRQLHRNDEVVARFDPAFANHRESDADGGERSRGSWATLHCKHHGDYEPERDLVGKRSRGRKCDRRADNRYGCLYCSGGTDESEHDNH
jgi:hypothetical protein